MAAFDLAAANLALFKQYHWLSDARNVQQLWLTEPAWQSELAVPVVIETQDNRATMLAWSVAQRSDFLEQPDLHLPATHLRTNGVRGADLLRMDEGTLVSVSQRAVSLLSGMPSSELASVCVHETGVLHPQRGFFETRPWCA